MLIRALEPFEGLDAMRARRGLERAEDLCSGPGKLTQALGLWLDNNGTSLQDGPVRIEPRPAPASRRSASARESGSRTPSSCRGASASAPAATSRARCRPGSPRRAAPRAPSRRGGR